MMADLALVWYTMLDSDVRATREQVQGWARELSLPAGTLTKTSTLGAFRKAHGRTVLEYEDADGVVHTMTSRQGSKSREVVKYEVFAHNDGEVAGKKVAEVKLFQQRRTVRGVLRGSQPWKATIKPSLAGVDREAAEAWVEKFRRIYNEIAVDAPSGAVRRICRLALLEDGIPVLNRLGVYLFYVDQLAIAGRVEEFLGRCVDNVDVAVIPILPDPRQKHRFAESADAHMVGRIGELGDAVHSWAARENAAPATMMYPRFVAESNLIAERIEEHERRLSSTLPHARSVLAQCQQMIAEVADLPVPPTE
jgi:hypothetical protein